MVCICDCPCHCHCMCVCVSLCLYLFVCVNVFIWSSDALPTLIIGPACVALFCYVLNSVFVLMVFCVCVPKPDMDMNTTQKEGGENAVCQRLGLLVGGLREVVQTAAPPGPCLAAVLKSLTKFFSSLLTLTKYVSRPQVTPLQKRRLSWSRLTCIYTKQIKT